MLERVGKRLRQPCIAKGQKVDDLELFLKVLQTRDGSIPVHCDQEECLRVVVHNTAGYSWKTVVANRSDS